MELWRLLVLDGVLERVDLEFEFLDGVLERVDLEKVTTLLA